MTIDLHGISQDAADLIINEETGGETYYSATESHPDWPGGASGVTIGQGYDCGYATPDEIFADWSGRISADAVTALQSVAGIHGSPAQSHARELHWITVPWDAALTVFYDRDLPKWVGIVERALPNCDQLHGDQLGATTSLAFNRGASFDLPGDRYSEMRAIKAHMAAQRFDLIPAEFLAMRRLWPEGGDLWKRRGHEAALFGRRVHGSPWWVQFSLNLAGASPQLAVDGIISQGGETEAAIRAFRLGAGLPDSPDVDDALCKAIDARLAAMPAVT